MTNAACAKHIEERIQGSNISDPNPLMPSRLRPRFTPRMQYSSDTSSTDGEKYAPCRRCALTLRVPPQMTCRWSRRGQRQAQRRGVWLQAGMWLPLSTSPRTMFLPPPFPITPSVHCRPPIPHHTRCTLTHPAASLKLDAVFKAKDSNAAKEYIKTEWKQIHGGHIRCTNSRLVRGIVLADLLQ